MQDFWTGSKMTWCIFWIMDQVEVGEVIRTCPQCVEMKDFWTGSEKTWYIFGITDQVEVGEVIQTCPQGAEMKEIWSIVKTGVVMWKCNYVT